MENWEIFEQNAVNFLNGKFGNLCKFVGSGGHNSAEPDILVYKKDKVIFHIESKSPVAQCGQFVLTPNFRTLKFEFSKQNHSSAELAVDILSYMNKNFKKFCTSSTRGENIELPEKIMFDWVIKYYSKIKGTKYFITQYNNNYIICNIKNLSNYFRISSKYRIKKSGSSVPSYNNIEEIISIVKQEKIKINKNPEINNGECIIYVDCDKTKFILSGSNYRYQFNKVGNRYNIRRLSNTSNANVIFSIISIKEQAKEDMDLFIHDITNL